MQITMNQEELVQAMNFRPKILTELYLLKQEMTYVENIVQRHSSQEVKKAIAGFVKRTAESIKELQAAGISLEKFDAAYMHKS